MSIDRERAKRWVTGGPYLSEKLIVRCLRCNESSLVTAESELGATIWLPPECPNCGLSWESTTPWEIDEI